MQKLFFSFLTISFLLLIGCKKSDNQKNQKEEKPELNRLSVYLTDNPADLEKVNIDIVSVQVKMDDDEQGNEEQIALLDDNANDDSLGASGGTLWNGGTPHGDGDEFGKWVAIDFVPGVYDILKLRNGVEMLLGSVETAGIVRKIRLAIGENSHVVKNGVSYPLRIADDSVNHNVYINIMKESRVLNSDGSVSVYLDFDLGRSITEMKGTYFLFPYLRALPADRSLEIEGIALPAEADIIVSVYNGTDSVTAIPDENGYFKINGLELDTYYAKYKAGNLAYKDTTISNIVVTKNKLRLPDMILTRR